jgi:hypothetical protein
MNLEMRDLHTKIAALEISMQETKAASASSSSAATQSILNHELRRLVPQSTFFQFINLPHCKSVSGELRLFFFASNQVLFALIFRAQKLTLGVNIVCKLECANGGHPDELCRNCTNCDAGFGGKWCHVPASCADKCDGDIKKCLCRHGGELDSATCACKCPPGWSGARCTTMVELPAAAINDRVAFLQSLYNRSMARQEQDQEVRRKRSPTSSDMLPHHLGQGVDGYTREMKAPVIQVSLPSDLGAAQRVVSPRTGRSYIVPDRVSFAASSDATPSMRSEVFSNVKDYVAWAKELRASGSYVPGATLVRSLNDIIKLFQTYQTSFVSVTQLTLNMFSASLDAATAGYDTFQLEENCARALDYLPAAYDADSRELYKTFLDYWGDSFVTDVVEGGMVESVHAVHKTVCKSIPSGTRQLTYLSDRQRNFMGKYFGVNGLSMSNGWTTDLSYEENAAADSAACSGGDPVQCANTLKAKGDLTPWTQSLWDLPSPVSIKIKPVTDMIRDPAKKAAMQQAIDARNEERTAAYASTGREASICPAEYTARPAGWNPIFGTLACLRQNADCWQAHGAYVKLCHIAAFIPQQNLFGILCIKPDNTELRFLIPAQALGYDM